jgi:diaminopropionate ammonia-lyase
MFLLNTHPDYRKPLDPVDAKAVGVDAVASVERFLAFRHAAQPTPLVTLPSLADHLGIAALHLKDESTRLGLGSFKALGGSYAVLRLVLDEATRQLGRSITDFGDLQLPEVQAVARRMTFGCATDGNHGRSVAAGAALVGARAVIFVHQGVSEQRAEAIAGFGADVVRVAGTYDDSVAEASRVCEENGWIVVSDTSWPGYEHIPAMVMQGYTAMVHEALEAIPEPPTHVFIQAGVGGLAAAVAGHLRMVLGERRPTFVVVEPSRAACLYLTARAGKPVKIEHGEPTVMAMLECYEPSLIGWRVLARCADAFMTIDEEEAVEAMRLLAHPTGNDRPVVSGESGGAGLAGLYRAIRDDDLAAALKLDRTTRALVINTEGATDPDRYAALVGATPVEVAAGVRQREQA